MAYFPKPHPFRRRRWLVHSRRWQRRIIFMAGAFMVGLVAVALAGAADEAADLFRAMQNAFP